jgi:predicted ABC-type transport system involved in lysophospholipase L1 biosynthesis ATPase subunit
MPKLAAMGVEVLSASDIALLPDSVFERVQPKGGELKVLLAELRMTKAQRAGAVAAAGAGMSTLLYTVEGLRASRSKK